MEWVLANWVYSILVIAIALVILSEFRWTRGIAIDIEKAINPPAEFPSLIDGKGYYEILCKWDDRLFEKTGCRPSPPLTPFPPLPQVYSQIWKQQVEDAIDYSQVYSPRKIGLVDDFEHWLEIPGNPAKLGFNQPMGTSQMASNGPEKRSSSKGGSVVPELYPGQKTSAFHRGIDGIG